MEHNKGDRYHSNLEEMAISCLDVKATYVNGVLTEEVYMTQPQGFEVNKQSELVCRLKRTICGLQKYGQAWYMHINL